MQNNPNQQIHTDYQINDVFKPEAANQLARAIHYDFVITQEMLDKYREKHPSYTTIDIGSVIASNSDGTDGPWETPVLAPVNILIAAKTSVNDPYTLHFGSRLIGHRSGVANGYIVDCEDFMDDGYYTFRTTRDMINVYSVYPYRLYEVVAGFNHWSTPVNYVKIESTMPMNSGVFKVGSYTMDQDFDMGERDSFQIVSQNAQGGRFIINPSSTHISTGYNPAVVYADWMGGGGITTSYSIDGTDVSGAAATAYGLYQQMQASITEWNTEPILTVNHSQSSARYQLSGWDDNAFKFLNIAEGKSVTIYKDGTIGWGTSGGSGSGSSDIIVFQDDGVVVPYINDIKFVTLYPQRVADDNQIRYSLLQNGQFTIYDSKLADIPLFKIPYAANTNGLRPYGTNHIVWNTWYQIKAYGLFDGDDPTTPFHIKTITNGAAGATLTSGHNGLSALVIVTDTLIDGLVYEVDINIRAIAKVSQSEYGNIDPNNERYGQMYAPDRYTKHFSLSFYTATGSEIAPKRWADSSYTYGPRLYPRFNPVPSNGDGTGFGPSSHSGEIAPVLATAKVYFVKIGENIFAMSY